MPYQWLKGILVCRKVERGLICSNNTVTLLQQLPKMTVTLQQDQVIKYCKQQCYKMIVFCVFCAVQECNLVPPHNCGTAS